MAEKGSDKTTIRYPDFVGLILLIVMTFELKRTYGVHRGSMGFLSRK
jgi:hypothetical protein